MARVFITGSSTGLGQLAAQRLVAQKHRVVLHARNTSKAAQAHAAVPGAEAVVVGDLSRMDEVKQLAADINALGRFDAVIHNAGLYRAAGADILAVNTLAPYALTCLIDKPYRLVYLSSGDHRSGHANIEGLNAGSVSYADSKLHDLMFAKAFARLWPDVYATAVDPGWVPTRMGGAGAPENLADGAETQAWLAVSDDDDAKVSGAYFYHMKQARYNSAADDVAMQDALLEACARITGVALDVAP